MIPAVSLTEIDGALGVQSSGKPLLAILGCSSTGTAGEPGAYASKSDVRATFGIGPLVEAGCYAIEAYRQPVILVRVTGVTPGAIIASVDTFASPYQNATITGVPLDDAGIYIQFLNDGTVGTDAITYRISFDDQVNWTPARSMGLLSSFTIPELGITVTLEIQPVAEGDQIVVLMSGPAWQITELGTALEALGKSKIKWRIAEIVGPMSASDATAVDLIFQGFSAAGKERAWIGGARLPTFGEAESAYLASLSAAFANVDAKHGMVCAGGCHTTSGISFLKQLRSPVNAVGPRQAAISEEEDSAAIDLGSLPGVSIRDTNGNPLDHDETANPGLDDARFCVLRTWEDLAGVYINNPNLMSAEGSDFQYFQHRLVMAIGKEALYAYLRRRLSKAVSVDKTTGFILESEALEIEAGAETAMRSALLARPKASAVEFTLSRTDNVLSTKTLTGQARITPLAYPKTIEVPIGFTNPALKIEKV